MNKFKLILFLLLGYQLNTIAQPVPVQTEATRNSVRGILELGIDALKPLGDEFPEIKTQITKGQRILADLVSGNTTWCGVIKDTRSWLSKTNDILKGLPLLQIVKTASKKFTGAFGMFVRLTSRTTHLCDNTNQDVSSPK